MQPQQANKSQENPTCIRNFNKKKILYNKS